MRKFPDVMKRQVGLNSYVECCPERADILRSVGNQRVGSEPPESPPENEYREVLL